MHRKQQLSPYMVLHNADVFYFYYKWRLNHCGYDTVPTNGRKCAKIHGTTICQNALYDFSMPQMIYGVIFHTK